MTEIIILHHFNEIICKKLIISPHQSYELNIIIIIVVVIVIGRGRVWSNTGSPASVSRVLLILNVNMSTEKSWVVCCRTTDFICQRSQEVIHTNEPIRCSDVYTQGIRYPWCLSKAPHLISRQVSNPQPEAWVRAVPGRLLIQGEFWEGCSSESNWASVPDL